MRAHDVPTGAQRSAGRLIAAMMLVCAGVSILRTYLLGGIVHDPQDLLLLHYVWTETAFLCAIAIAGVTYLRVLRSPNKPPLRTALRLSCLIHACAAFALPYTSYDVLLNLAYGRLLSLGLNPYRYSPSALPAGDPFILDASSPWSSHVSVWGPISVVLSRLGVIFENLWLSVLWMKFLVLVISIAILLLAFWLAKRSTEAHHSRDAFLFVAWNPLFAWELSGQAHNDGVMLLFAFLFLSLCARGHIRTAWVSLWLAFWSKFAVAPWAGLHLLWCLRQRRPSTLFGVLIFGLLAAAFSIGFWNGWSALGGLLNTTGWNPEFVTRSFLALILEPMQLLGEPISRTVFAVWTAVSTILLVLLALRFMWRTNGEHDVTRYSLLLILLYLLVGKAWFLPWYVLWLLPLSFATRDAHLRWIVAVYSVCVPALYLPKLGFGLGVLIAHGVPLVLLLRRRADIIEQAVAERASS